MLDKTDAALQRTPEEHVRELTLDRVRHCLSSPVGVSVYEDLKGLCTTVSTAYRDRAVLELLQNAHDAHEAGRVDGRIRLLLEEEEGEHGVLYAANDGRGFTRGNFEALCSPTRTTKAVNEAIGNKGVGFLSVFQICAHPEVYSRPQPTPSPDFEGYCFSFAGRDRLEAFLTDEGLAHEVDRIIEEMPQLYVATPIHVPLGRVAELGLEGFATVLRLPLKTSDARLAVASQLRDLAIGRPEVQLFLDRIVDLTITYDEGTFALGRISKVLQGANGFTLERVACGEACYILARQRIDEEIVKAAIEENIAAEALPASWRSWTGDAVVSIAVAASGAPLEGRLYNFLPMDASARAPLAGHLDAPFFATIERKRLEVGVAFNDTLLDYCRALALRAAEAARHCLGDSEARSVVADFLFWDGDGAEAIRTALLEGGTALIPAERRGVKPSWGALADIRLWRRNDFFDATRVARIAPFPIVDNGLGDDRLARLERFATAGGLLAVSSAEKVDLAVSAAEALHAASGQITDWNRFYASLPALLKGHGQLLQGRRVLLTERGDLTEALEAAPRGRGRRRLVNIFLPPLRSSGIGPALPGAVQRRIAYLHRELACSIDGADEGRRFLLTAGLVRDYDRRELLRVMASVIADTGQAKDPEAVRWEVLAAIKAVCAAVEGGLGDAAALLLLVPTRDGWTRASDAFFGDWPGTDSADLDELFERASPVSQELAEQGRLRLRPYGDWDVAAGDRDGWIGFMRAAGVADRLRPMAVFAGPPLRASGAALVNALAARETAISVGQRAAWCRQLQAMDLLPNPNTDYTVRDVRRFPGQIDWEAIATVAADAYAVQVVRMLEADPGLLRMEVYRPFHGSYPNRRAWPSPAGAFLAQEAWLPIVDGARRRVAGSWMPAVDGATPPAQAPLIATRLRRLIDRSDRARQVLEAYGLATFGATVTAWPLIEQAPEWVEGSALPAERLLAITQEAWRQADLGRPLPEGLRLLVRVGGEVRAVDPRTDDRPIYVADAEDRATTGLVARASPGAVIFEPPIQRAQRIGEYLGAQLGDRVLRMSAMDIVHLTPNGDFAFDPSDPFIEDVLGFDLRGVVALTVRYRCLFSNISADTALARLAALRIRWLDTLGLRVGDHVQPVPSFRQAAVLARSSDGDTVLAPLAARGSEGELLVLAAAIGEALGSRRNIGDPVLAVAAQLQRIGDGVTPASLAEALDLTVEDVAAMLRDARALLAELRRVARPFLILWAGVEAAERILDAPELASETDLVAALVDTDVLQDAAAFVEACRAGSVETIALQWDVDLGALNAVLVELGAPWRPIDRSAHHEDGFRGHFVRQEAAAREAVRAAFQSAFEAGDVSSYVAIRDRATPTPPEGIGAIRLRSDATDWALWLQDWLDEVGATMGARRPGIGLGEVRERNRRMIKAMAPRARSIILARKADAAQADFWSEPSTLADRLAAVGTAGGWLDFDVLDEASAVGWLQRTGLWPVDWPATLELEPHGTTEDLLTAWEAEDRRRREAAARPKRTLAFTGGAYVVGETKLADLTEAIAALAGANRSLLASSMRTVKGDPVTLPPRGQGGGGGSSRTARRDRMTDEERGVIGYFGEAIAFAWLKAKFGDKRVIDEGCWKSEYRRHLCGVGGDDTLGYDFEVTSGRVTWFFEVKATSSSDPGDLRMVELGSTEIACAELCRSENRQHYRILHVVDALHPERAVLRVLPNPRSREGKAFYTEQTSAGVRLYFPGPK